MSHWRRGISREDQLVELYIIRSSPYVWTDFLHFIVPNFNVLLYIRYLIQRFYTNKWISRKSIRNNQFSVTNNCGKGSSINYRIVKWHNNKYIQIQFSHISYIRLIKTFKNIFYTILQSAKFEIKWHKIFTNFEKILE